MARKAFQIGPSALSLIEDAPVGLVRAVLRLRESDNEPDFGLPEPTDEQVGDDPRQQILDALSQFDQEDLHPLERRCRRIRMLAEGKGVSSIDTIAEQRLADDQYTNYVSQPDPLCRSIWVYLNFQQVVSPVVV